MWKILLREYADDLKTQKTRVALTMLAITYGLIASTIVLPDLPAMSGGREDARRRREP